MKESRIQQSGGAG